jgi:hypothetical protein
LFGKDIAAKSIIFFQQKATLNMMIESIKAATTSQYAQQAPPPPPPRQRPERSERPQRPEPAEKVETVDVEEENNFAVEEPEEKQTSSVRKVGRPRKKI